MGKGSLSEEVLVCRCEDCTHWEVTRTYLVCKTCGVIIPSKFETPIPISTGKSTDLHNVLHWEVRDV